MCIAIVLPPGKRLERTTLEICREAHQHGMGFAYVDSSGNLKVNKYLDDFNGFASHLNKAFARNETSHFLVHFRTASAGKKTKENCHPHLNKGKTLALVHNGTFSKFSFKDCSESDTVNLMELVVNDLGTLIYENQSVRYLFEEFIGWQKVAILTKNNEIIVFNKKSWEQQDDIWFSNDSYKKRAAIICPLWIQQRRSENLTGSNSVGYYTYTCEICGDAVGFDYSYENRVLIHELEKKVNNSKIRICKECIGIPDYLRIAKASRRPSNSIKVLGHKWWCMDCNKGFYDYNGVEKIQAGCPDCNTLSYLLTDSAPDRCPKCEFEIRYRADAIFYEATGYCAECGIEAYKDPDSGFAAKTVYDNL